MALSGATTGKVAEYNTSEPALLNQRVGRFVFHAPEYIHQRFAAHLIETIRQKVLSEAYGAAQPNISPLQIAELVVPLPPLSEQIRIGESVDRSLSICDSVERECDDSLERASRLRQAILKRAFSGQLVPQDPKDEPGGELLARIGAERDKINSNSKPKKPRRTSQKR